VGVLSALAAAQLLAAAAGRPVSPWGHLPLPATAGGWIMPLAVTGGMLLLLIIVEVQRSEQIVAVSVSGTGAVLVPADTLERLVEGVALDHREVVRARARVQSREGRLAPRLWVALRPLADAKSITGELAREVAATLASRTGLPFDEPRVRAKTLAVRQLRRYLP
jgi:hypothetical protein